MSTKAKERRVEERRREERTREERKRKGWNKMDGVQPVAYPSGITEVGWQDDST